MMRASAAATSGWSAAASSRTSRWPSAAEAVAPRRSAPSRAAGSGWAASMAWVIRSVDKSSQRARAARPTEVPVPANARLLHGAFE
ncbi:hypothetical protein ACFV2X_23270 [Streptomyces sp. NPDC059679]|uniref:hypothetical protein n=1 Tax=Streptomyces sp. NPDC059679 TaxID=3346903 RepID=UPI003674F122